MDSPADRRAHQRYELLAQVRVKRGKVDYLMELSNISRGGALFSLGTLEPPAWALPGRSIEVAIIHPVDLDSIDIKGEIMRVQRSEQETSLGVRFVELAEHQQAAIDRLVQLAAGSRPPPDSTTMGSVAQAGSHSSAPPADPAAPPRKGPPPLPT